MTEEKKIFLKEQGRRLASARWKKGMTQVELSKLLGYSDSTTIYKIEKGLQDIPRKREDKICEALEITRDYLRGFSVDESQAISYSQLLRLLTAAERMNMSLHDFKESVKDWQSLGI